MQDNGQMRALFEIALGIVLCIAGVRVLLVPEMVVVGHQLEMSAYNKPLGIFICAAGLLWVLMGAKRKG